MGTTTRTLPEQVTDVCRDGEFSETVVTAVAEAKGVDPLEIEPLYTVVDPDALNKIFQPGGGTPQPSMEFRFSMSGCRVVIHGDGEIVVTPLAEGTDHSATFTPYTD